ncbi:MAG: biotin--[acetyl-CoA-carboxylase] ligase [Blastopirellula sp.]|mgnify:CR=1 FL=1|nr:biotin--[acetyl-CoA-carboxylase] ligase [Blastopirellula sp.]|tara:strand:+ start:149 stop:982 length:834 start_codon:yes stop_codon:yes gene_type:complete
MQVTDRMLATLRERYTILETALYDETTSTNDQALTLATALPSDASSEHGILALLVAHRQTAGRGRRHREWWSTPGALMFSVLIDMDQRQIPRNVWPQASLTTGMAVTRALRQVDPQGNFQLKWPNDVYLSEKKVCGILIEAPPTPHARLVLGIGINVANSFQHAPPELLELATAMVDHSHKPPSLDVVLAAVLAEIDNQFILLSQTQDDATAAALLWQRWQEWCLLENRTVTLAHEGREIHGRCDGIDRDGALLISSPTGTERYFAGSIVNFSDYVE